MKMRPLALFQMCLLCSHQRVDRGGASSRAPSGIRQELSQTELASGQLCTHSPFSCSSTHLRYQVGWKRGLKRTRICANPNSEFTRTCSYNEMYVNTMREIYR